MRKLSDQQLAQNIVTGLKSLREAVKMAEKAGIAVDGTAENVGQYALNFHDAGFPLTISRLTMLGEDNNA